MAALGADVLDYIPDFAFKVRMNPAQARQVADLAAVARIGVFQPAYKLDPALLKNDIGIYLVRVERGPISARSAPAIAASGAEVSIQAEGAEDFTLGQEGGVLMVAADAAQLVAIANIPDVA